MPQQWCRGEDTTYIVPIRPKGGNYTPAQFRFHSFSWTHIRKHVALTATSNHVATQKGTVESRWHFWQQRRERDRRCWVREDIIESLTDFIIVRTLPKLCISSYTGFQISILLKPHWVFCKGVLLPVTKSTPSDKIGHILPGVFTLNSVFLNI